MPLPHVRPPPVVRPDVADENRSLGDPDFLMQEISPELPLRDMLAAIEHIEKLKERHPAIPWRKVAGIGNILRHDYEEIIPDAPWKLAHEIFPPSRPHAGRSWKFCSTPSRAFDARVFPLRELATLVRNTAAA